MGRGLLCLPERPIRRILAIRRKGLGDALVCLPAVFSLAAAYPDARLDLVLDRQFAPLFDRLAAGVNVLVWPPQDRRPLSWIRRLREARYDLVVDFLGNPRTAIWTALTGAPLRVGYQLGLRSLVYNLIVPRLREGPFPLRQFAGEAFLDPLRAFGLHPDPWRVNPGSGSGFAPLRDPYLNWRRDWEKTSRPRVGLVMSATWPAKAWPARNASRLWRGLAEQGYTPLVISGPGDEAFEAALRRDLPENAFSPGTNLPELADLLLTLDLAVGTDCGPRHLAASLGLPTITLFGPTESLGWNPKDPRHVALSQGVSCSPCGLTVCPVPGHPCLDELGAEKILAKVAQVIQNEPGGRPVEKGAES